jgi:hypothetical protein
MPAKIIKPPMVGVPAFFDDVRLRPVGADRLAFALQQPQPVDHELPEQKNEDERGNHRSAGAEGDVAKDIQDRELVREFDQPIKHLRFNSLRARFRAALGATTNVATP